MLRRSASGLSVLIALTLLLLSTAPPTEAAAVPAGFADGFFATGLSAPTAMAFAPDGRLFVTQQQGALRVIKNGGLLPTPFVTLAVDSQVERGLLGVAFDPAFNSNHFVYVYYTTTSGGTHNRVSRFTANGDVAVPGSEAVILDLDPLSAAMNHNGGAIHFGPDGKLYIAVGDNANGGNAQSLNTVLGKMLRINSDGSFPADNPFFAQTTGKNRAIWAWGLRNPFTFAFQPGTGRMFINDVGESTWEEINDGIAGSNYGWPTTEGMTSLPQFRSPLFVYGHGNTANTGCAITGGSFYNPPVPNFPSSYAGKYFYSDLCSGWIRVFDPATLTDAPFATGITNPVDLQVGPDGALYYASFGGGAIGRISFSSAAQAIDSPGGGVVAPSFTVGGWAIDRAATNGTGIDNVHVYVYPSDAAGNINGAAMFLGQAIYGISRSDVAALYGPQFTSSGFGLAVSNLAAGNYQLTVFAHSSVSNVWNPIQRFIQVQAPISNPAGAIDAPPGVPNNVPRSFAVSGWTIDRGAPSGTGVDLVHVYVYPIDTNGTVTGAAQFLGQAGYGAQRPDVGNAFGARFAPSGFVLSVNNLVAGRYQLTVFAHSTVTGAWNTMLRQINVAASQSQPAMAIDTPPPNTQVGATIAVNGWATDLGAASGTGIDAVHIYLYPADANGNPTGAAPIFLGVASYGAARPDVGNVFGAQFTNSAYTLTASMPAPGTYMLAVFSRSTVSGNWNVLTRTVRR